MSGPRNAAHRRDVLWIAAQVHRISGVLLAAFLPVHFLTLALAIEGEARLDGFLKWAQNPAVKLVEAGLVFLLAVHLLGGVRVLAIENLPWRKEQKQMAIGAAAIALIVAIIFLVRAA